MSRCAAAAIKLSLLCAASAANLPVLVVPCLCRCIVACPMMPLTPPKLERVSGYPREHRLWRHEKMREGGIRGGGATSSGATAGRSCSACECARTLLHLLAPCLAALHGQGTPVSCLPYTPGGLCGAQVHQQLQRLRASSPVATPVSRQLGRHWHQHFRTGCSTTCLLWSGLHESLLLGVRPCRKQASSTMQRLIPSKQYAQAAATCYSSTTTATGPPVALHPHAADVCHRTQPASSLARMPWSCRCPNSASAASQGPYSCQDNAECCSGRCACRPAVGGSTGTEPLDIQVLPAYRWWCGPVVARSTLDSG